MRASLPLILGTAIAAVGCFEDPGPSRFEAVNVSLSFDLDGTTFVSVDEVADDGFSSDFRRRYLVVGPGATEATTVAMDLPAAQGTTLDATFVPRGVLMIAPDRAYGGKTVLSLRDRSTWAEIARTELPDGPRYTFSGGGRYGVYWGDDGPHVLDTEHLESLVAVGPTVPFADRLANHFVRSSQRLTLLTASNGRARLRSWPIEAVAAAGYPVADDGWLGGTDVDLWIDGVDPEGRAGSIAVSRDDEYFAVPVVRQGSNQIVLVERATGATQTIPYTRPPRAFSADGSKLFTASALDPDAIIEVDVVTGKSVEHLAGFGPDGLQDFVEVPDARALVVGFGVRLRRIDLETGTSVPFEGPENLLASPVVAGTRVFSKGYDGVIELDASAAKASSLTLPHEPTTMYRNGNELAITLEAPAGPVPFVHFFDIATGAARTVSVEAPAPR